MTASLDRRLHAWRDDLADITLEGKVASARFVAGRPMRVVDAIAPLRRAPRPDAAQETEALCGEDLAVFETTVEGWAWVQLARDRYVGWMGLDALGPSDGAPTHEVVVPRTLVFPGPDIKQPPIGALPLGARVTVGQEATDRNATYALIEPAGAVVVQHLRPIGETAPDFVAVAERFLGVPYLWGGKTALGIDCSGLVQIALAQSGIEAPRDTDMQEAALGRALGDGETPVRGDLVFWKGHIAIMLDETRLLHANAFHMMTAIEPLMDAIARAEAKGSAVTSIRRL